MGHILLVRHGETDWNAQGRLQGGTDVPLNETGRAQARQVAASVAGAQIAAIVTSDLVRARETGEIIAAALGLAPPAIEPELREGAFGVFEGVLRSEVAERYPDAWRAWREQLIEPPGAEPRALIIERMNRAMARIAAEAGAAAGPTLVVSHGGAMRLWLMQIVGELLPPIPNGAVYEIEARGAGPQVINRR